MTYDSILMPPVIITVFGINGDLSRKKLIPALYHLFQNKHFDTKLTIIGFGRRDYSRNEFLNLLQETLPAKSQKLNIFLESLIYFKGDFSDTASFESLKKEIKLLTTTLSDSPIYIYYFATAPEFFGPISHNLQQTGLHRIGQSLPRIIVEKPFGHDLPSAIALDEELAGYYEEDQLYRIDHYLGKEAVKAILPFRHNHPDFEKRLHNAQVEAIEVLMAESLGIESRGAYYDHTGAIRDVIQNHGLQLLAQVLCDLPQTDDETAIRDARAEAIQQLQVQDAELGQYQGYGSEDKVSHDSRTETYAKVSFTSQSKRWQGVNLTIETGKRLQEKRTEIRIIFKNTPESFVFRIQPEPQLLSGDKVLAQFNENDAYDQLILDCINSNQTLFIRRDEVEAAWKCLEPILNKLATFPLNVY
jgi:glucose-6-phosphate 1-dehydrogenase